MPLLMRLHLCLKLRLRLRLHLRRLFLKDPSYPLRDPLAFADALVEAALQASQASIAQQQQQQQQQGAGVQGRLTLLYDCLTALLQQHALLGDHLTSAGYVPR